MQQLCLPKEGYTLYASLPHDKLSRAGSIYDGEACECPVLPAAGKYLSFGNWKMLGSLLCPHLSHILHSSFYQ